MEKKYTETDILENDQDKFNEPGYKKLSNPFKSFQKRNEDIAKDIAMSKDSDNIEPQDKFNEPGYKKLAKLFSKDNFATNKETANPLGRRKSSGMTSSVEAKENIEPKISGKLDTPVLKDFKTAFKEARKEGLENFMYGGKKFSTATAEDVKAAGYDNLKDYLNSRFKKKVQNETPTDLS